MIIHLKKAEESLFLYEITTNTRISDLTKKLCALQNLRQLVFDLETVVQDFIKYGVASKEPKLVEIEEQDPSKEPEIVLVEGYERIKRADPTGNRVGFGLTDQQAQMVLRSFEELLATVDKENAGRGILFNEDSVREKINCFKGALSIVYPMGIPSFDPMIQLLDDSNKEGDILEPSEMSLWWAGKELQQSKALCDYVGKNEKTKIVAKIQKSSHGAPSREFGLDPKSQREMMAYYYKKQEELKKLAEQDDGEDYLNSSWANPNQLKNQLHGISSVKWKPL